MSKWKVYSVMWVDGVLYYVTAVSVRQAVHKTAMYINSTMASNKRTVEELKSLFYNNMNKGSAPTWVNTIDNARIVHLSASLPGVTKSDEKTGNAKPTRSAQPAPRPSSKTPTQTSLASTHTEEDRQLDLYAENVLPTRDQ